MSISDNDVTDRYIQKSAQRFYRKANEVLSDLKSLTRDTKSRLLFKCLWIPTMALF